MNERSMNGADLPETDQQQAARALAQAREIHAAAYFAAKAAPGDPEEAALLHAAAQDGKQAYRGYVRAATAGLAAQIDDMGPK